MEKFQFWEIQQTKELSKRPIVKNLFQMKSLIFSCHKRWLVNTLE